MLKWIYNMIILHVLLWYFSHKYDCKLIWWVLTSTWVVYHLVILALECWALLLLWKAIKFYWKMLICLAHFIFVTLFFGHFSCIFLKFVSVLNFCLAHLALLNKKSKQIWWRSIFVTSLTKTKDGKWNEKLNSSVIIIPLCNEGFNSFYSRVETIRGNAIF